MDEKHQLFQISSLMLIATYILNSFQNKESGSPVNVILFYQFYNIVNIK